MSIFEHPDQLKQLQDLLNPKKQRKNMNDSDTDDDDDDESTPLMSSAKAITPATLTDKASCSSSKKAKTTPKPVSNSPYAPYEEKKPIKLIKSIEEWQAMQETEDAEILDKRKVPAYDMTYRQSVGTEDVFLGIGNRTNATASCENLILEISLPEETVPADKMDLQITEKDVDLATPIYRLKLALPHPINVDLCNAKYDSNLKKMILTLRLKRELDYLNF